MTNKTQVPRGFYLTDWITFQGGINEGMFLKISVHCMEAA